MEKVTLKDSKGNEINDIMKDVLTFDSETTGVPRKGAKWDVDFAEFPNIVQLAWSINGKERSYIIKPDGWIIPDEAIAVHGITNERANAEGVPFADIIDEFLEDCEKARLLVGHNIYFDTSIVKAMILRIMGREYYDAKAEDALFKGYSYLYRFEPYVSVNRKTGALIKKEDMDLLEECARRGIIEISK